MYLSRMAEKLGKKMKWYDYSYLKLTMFFMTLFLVTAWPGFRDVVLSIPWYWYLFLSVIMMIPLLIKMFSDRYY